jgi:hypothetical protein
VSSTGFILRFLLGLAVSVVAAMLVVGWPGAGRDGAVLAAGQSAGAWANPAELGWLERLGSWNTRLLRALQAGVEAGGVPASVQACGADLATKVGAPPAARLRSAYAAFRDACRRLRQGDARGGTLLLRADRMVPPGELRDLPVISGVTNFSRVEPRFGQIAGALARKQMEVRCWSTADWHRLMREEQTYTRGQLGSDTLGFAGIEGSRINLAPSVCDALVGLAYKGARPIDEAGRVLLASAVVTISHEPQHSKGISEEPVAECNAIQSANRTAMKLGASPAYAATLVRTYWRHYSEELPAYRSWECRKGGALDLGYADSIWP